MPPPSSRCTYSQLDAVKSRRSPAAHRTPSRGITHAALPSQLTDAAGPRSPLHRTSQSETAPSEPAAASRQNGL